MDMVLVLYVFVCMMVDVDTLQLWPLVLFVFIGSSSFLWRCLDDVDGLCLWMDAVMDEWNGGDGCFVTLDTCRR